MPQGDGIVCGNDELAIGALAALRRQGRRVPEDVAVTGYDDTPDDPWSPSLTTISPDKAALVRTTLDLLGERIQGYDGPPRMVDTPVASWCAARRSPPPRPPPPSVSRCRDHRCRPPREGMTR